MTATGVKKIIFTDIETDGTLEGPAYFRLEALQQTVDCDIIASGGVSCNQDIQRLCAMGLYGAIIGKAYYAGTIDLAQAVREGGAQC
jgi:phosphoribosylformimino-5-aminoimidazole carboxamide ribotide isomerase